jgi:hypothetical protein
MNIFRTELLVCGCLLAAVLVGVRLRRLLPDHHLSAETRDAVKLAMGLVATMTALVLGLLVSSAKGTFDTERNEVVQMGAKIAFLDRVLALYGPDAAEIRVQFHDVIVEWVRRMWPDVADAPVVLPPNPERGGAIYSAIQNLSARDETQRSLRTQASSVAVELGQLQTLLAAQGISSVSKPLMMAMLCWLVVIFLGFSLLSPPNATAIVALFASVFSVAIAVFLILELDQPMSGFIRLSSAPILNALNPIAK